MKLLAFAFVQIIGLAVVRNDPKRGVEVVLPRVEVEGAVQHTAVIIYQTSDLLAQKGWRPKKLLPVPGYSYVPLNGERIQLKVNSRNQRASVPAGLPHLTKGCAAMHTLKSGYQPPEYKSAVAVLSIPDGELSACRAKAPNVYGRIDTRVKLENAGSKSYQ